MAAIRLKTAKSSSPLRGKNVSGRLFIKIQVRAPPLSVPVFNEFDFGRDRTREMEGEMEREKRRA